MPDVRKVLARYVLSDDGTPLDVSFESAAVHLKLGAGTYFALFSAPTGSNGYVMCCASSPFDYRADSVPTGYYNPLDGTSFADHSRVPGDPHPRSLRQVAQATEVVIGLT